VRVVLPNQTTPQADPLSSARPGNHLLVVYSTKYFQGNIWFYTCNDERLSLFLI